MRYHDNQAKFFSILNRKVALPLALNASIHSMIGLVCNLSDEERRLLPYPFANGGFISKISFHPVIVLEARNANQLRAAARDAIAKGIAVNVFASAMLGQSADEQQAQTAATSFDDADLMAVSLFGQTDAVSALTRKFSALRAPTVLED